VLVCLTFCFLLRHSPHERFLLSTSGLSGGCRLASRDIMVLDLPDRSLGELIVVTRDAFGRRTLNEQLLTRQT